MGTLLKCMHNDESWRCLFFYFPKFLLFISMYKHWRWAVWDTCTVLMHIVLAYSVSVSIVYSLLLRWALLFWHSSDMCKSESTLFQPFSCVKGGESALEKIMFLRLIPPERSQAQTSFLFSLTFCLFSLYLCCYIYSISSYVSCSLWFSLLHWRGLLWIWLASISYSYNELHGLHLLALSLSLTHSHKRMHTLAHA